MKATHYELHSGEDENTLNEDLYVADDGEVYVRTPGDDLPVRYASVDDATRLRQLPVVMVPTGRQVDLNADALTSCPICIAGIVFRPGDLD